MTPVFYIPIAGTRAWNDRGQPKNRWWQSEGPFTQFMATLNCMMKDPDQPFVWSTDLNGIEFWRRWPIWFGKISRTRDHRDWVAAAENLIRYIEPMGCEMRMDDRNLIAHSHGGQVVFYACAMGMKVRRLITVATPERQDMLEVILKARANIEKWHHIYDSNKDSIATWGEFGDGSFSTDRSFKIPKATPDTQISVPGISHSKILYEPAFIKYWQTQGYADLLR